MFNLDDVRQIIKECEKITGINFVGELTVNSRLKRALGRTVANVGRNQRNEIYSVEIGIEISKNALECANEKELNEIVKHEFAHYLMFRKGDFTHTHNNYEFKKFCKQLKTESEKSMSLEKEIVRNYKYEATCKCCGKCLKKYVSSNADIIRNNGKGYMSNCCHSNVIIKKL